MWTIAFLDDNRAGAHLVVVPTRQKTERVLSFSLVRNRTEEEISLEYPTRQSARIKSMGKIRTVSKCALRGDRSPLRSILRQERKGDGCQNTSKGGQMVPF